MDLTLEDRLDRLMRERRNGVNKEEIDARIWDLFGETWAVMFTDLSGFTERTARYGIIHFLQVLHEAKKVMFPIIESHDGFLLKQMGDSFLIIFRDAKRGLQCATEMQTALKEYNKGKPDEDDVLLCVGLGYGRILKIGDDVYGNEVNLASKLGEDVAKAGEILMTPAARERIEGGVKCHQNLRLSL
jgi:class 3 adenylate cyclase